MTLTTRHKLKLWWTTSPSLGEYSESKSLYSASLFALLESSPFIGTARQVQAELQRVRSNVGQGAYLRTIIHAADGREVRIDEINDCVAEAENRKRFRDWYMRNSLLTP